MTFSAEELKNVEGRSALSYRHLQNRAYAQRARRRLAELLWWEDMCPRVHSSRSASLRSLAGSRTA